MTIAAVKVPIIANVMIAPKFEKNGFYIEDGTVSKDRQPKQI